MDEKCRTCGAPADDGEGWDGECGNCADRRETERADAAVRDEMRSLARRFRASLTAEELAALKAKGGKADPFERD